MVVTKRDCKRFGQAFDVAVSGENKVRVGAVLTKGRTTLAMSYNRFRNDVSNVEYGSATKHAERVALVVVPASILFTLLLPLPLPFPCLVVEVLLLSSSSLALPRAWVSSSSGL